MELFRKKAIRFGVASWRIAQETKERRSAPTDHLHLRLRQSSGDPSEHREDQQSAQPMARLIDSSSVISPRYTAGRFRDASSKKLVVAIG